MGSLAPSAKQPGYAAGVAEHYKWALPGNRLLALSVDGSGRAVAACEGVRVAVEDGGTAELGGVVVGFRREGERWVAEVGGRELPAIVAPATLVVQALLLVAVALSLVGARHVTGDAITAWVVGPFLLIAGYGFVGRLLAREPPGGALLIAAVAAADVAFWWARTSAGYDDPPEVAARVGLAALAAAVWVMRGRSPRTA